MQIPCTWDSRGHVRDPPQWLDLLSLAVESQTFSPFRTRQLDAGRQVARSTVFVTRFGQS